SIRYSPGIGEPVSLEQSNSAVPVERVLGRRGRGSRDSLGEKEPRGVAVPVEWTKNEVTPLRTSPGRQQVLAQQDEGSLSLLEVLGRGTDDLQPCDLVR